MTLFTNLLRRPASMVLAVTLALAWVVPAAAADPSPSESIPAASEVPTPTTAPASPLPVESATPASVTAAALPAATLTIAQKPVAYDMYTNRRTVDIKLTPANQVAPWQYRVTIAGILGASGTTTTPAVVTRQSYNCSAPNQAFAATLTDAAARTAGAAATLNRTMCPATPVLPRASDSIKAGPTLTEASFIARLRTVSSPALPEGSAIYQALIAGGINPAFALGTFQAESSSGKNGYATVTRNWGNILYYSWEAAFGAVPYAPGNGYTYASYPTWIASVRAYVDLLGRYHTSGYTTVSKASSHWLGTYEGSDRHMPYLRNITSTMSALPDDAVPTMTALVLPATSASTVTATWSAKDNVAVTGYELRTHDSAGVWSASGATVDTKRTFTRPTGPFTVSVRARDGAGNLSAWREATVRVDADAPVMTGLVPSTSVPRAANGTFTVAWTARDNIAVTGYAWRTRKNADGAWSTATNTTARSRTFALGAGSWYIGVRARDAVGNWSPERTVRVTVPVDDRSFSFSSGTVRQTGSSYYRGTITKTSRSGSRMSATFTGTGFYLIGTIGPYYGKMRITIDGTSTTIDARTYKGARATSNHYRQILFSKSLAAGSHTFSITNLATPGRPTIAIDGIGFAR
ncbi:MAG TPA: hypothetical protein VIK13_18520 [Candidatus Limnocylindrales bacterium]